ncbi:MAG: glycine cleavage system aminomethyltransferase GcvT [Alphaproteobacteria bacterium]|nr:glycine cleavage system aminomethyltransferase GcvT [Alphaproteobacteria bacterium]
MGTAASSASGPLQTPLHALHRERGARLVPFAGYEMPVQYPAGIIAEHRHTRGAASLFDVSYMGQATLRAAAGHDAATVFERLVPGDIVGLAPGQMRYTLLLAPDGGIRDDLMAMRAADSATDLLHLVVNAGTKDTDVAHMSAALGGRATVERHDDRALLALQGPQAAAVMARLAPDAAALRFMHGAPVAVAGFPCLVMRSGYTGEDGFEISVADDAAEALARRLLAEPEVAPAGLGARDSLRLEAGLCLYGHDIDRTTGPVEAGLAWTIAKRRRAAADFPGAAPILAALVSGSARRRVGLRPEGRQPVREGADILDAAGDVVGRVTSGGWSPTLDAPIAMGYVAAGHAAPGTSLAVTMRGKAVACAIAALPFVVPNYRR